MRVADYISWNPVKMIFCNAGINRNYMVLTGDEYFYSFMGRTVNIHLSDYIHPLLQAEFRETCDSLKEGESVRLLTAMHGMEEEYHQVDILISSRGHKVQGEPVLDLTIYNLLTIESKYLDTSNDANRYRTILSLYHDFLFDYDVEKDIISVFHYMSIKSTVLLKCSLAEFRERVTAMYPRAALRAGLEDFCEHLLNAQEYFDCDLKGPVPRNTGKIGLFHIEGKVIYKHNKERVVVGILRMLDQKNEDVTPYYATAEGKDSFTGLLNKKACAEYVEDTLAADKEVHYLAMIDIDNFKNINDTFGHMYGDQVIAKVASIINSTLNGRGIVGRFGGDEFFIFTNWITTENQLRAILTSIRKRVQNTFEDQNCKVTLSIGVSHAPADGTSYQELFRKADKCLYVAKYKGKNRYVIYEENKHGKLEEDERSFRHTMDPLEKAEYLAGTVADISLRLFAEGIKPMEEIVDQLRTAFEIDGVRIYRSGQREPLYISGDYPVLPDMYPFIAADELAGQLNHPHYLIASHIGNLEGINRKLYEVLKDSKVKGMMCFCFPDRSGRNLYFFYDVFTYQPPYPESNKNSLLTISRIMAGIL